MAVFNYKQLVYAGMVAIAGVNEVVDKKERKHIDKVFDHFMSLSKKDKKEVIEHWETKKKDAFTSLLIDEMKPFPKADQAEIHKYMMHFITYSKNEYLKGNAKLEKGVDSTKAEMHDYQARVNYIFDRLDQETKPKAEEK